MQKRTVEVVGSKLRVRLIEHGFLRQLEAIKGYATAHRISISKVYREEGVTGALECMNRPAWMEMVGRILANGVRRKDHLR